MQEWKELDPFEWSCKPAHLWGKQWLLLTAGTFEDANMMTVGWGSFGCMWNRPFAQIVVRPQRHTYSYLERYDTFSLCAFAEEYRKDLQTMGTLSGRDGDKLKYCHLTLRRGTRIEAPSYNEAELIIECRKKYVQDMDPAGFLDPAIEKNYPQKDYHRIYFGEIAGVFVRC
ncbi:MAG: flavin reductase family protein [Lentisphaerae bacterium]|nr:MAG: flavin reductase family protein [Lentisphaerota bacterium]